MKREDLIIFHNDNIHHNLIEEIAFSALNYLLCRAKLFRGKRVGSGRIISWELARGVRHNLTRGEL
jgi:hypothetical protein